MKNFPVTINPDYLEEQYQRWKADPESVPDDWRWFFQGFDLATEAGEPAIGVPSREDALRQARVEELIRRYREWGHLLSCLDPLEPCPWEHPLLSLESCGLSSEDLDRVVPTPSIALWEEAPLGDVVTLLKETYCRSVGAEFMHLADPQERQWLRDRMEAVRNLPDLPPQTRRHMLEKLWRANRFEQFLHRTYLGQKRFSLEGAETVVPMLDGLIRRAAALGCETLVLGMAHRGRLNVQVNVLGKPFEAVFAEFEESCDTEAQAGSGDVKYHKGFQGSVDAGDGRRVRTILVPNPSHLESVDPVVEGLARALQDTSGDGGSEKVLPVLIHGDSAFAGQGVVYETLNLSQLPGYGTGGTLHLVINNQIGFTTVAAEARSTRYATDVAKMLPAPIFHVHGEDPDAALHVIQLACEYRYHTGKDVVIDLICYRRYGHNEGDEPYYTQPRMVERIRERPPVNEVYGARLQQQGVTSPEDVERLEKEIQDELEKALAAARSEGCVFPEGFSLGPAPPPPEANGEGVRTAVSEDRLRAIVRSAHTYPEGFHVNPKLEKILKRRQDRVEKGEGLDWSTGELLALGSLLLDGHPVRLSGQDCGRGTFSHRHAILYDVKTEATFVPLNHLAPDQAHLAVYNSSLSEYAVLGFEYGYSLPNPRALVIWEAQFGDFANNAQVIIDQYVSSAQAKWEVASGLVLLLPHGYEGMGPEHSSARLERFLQLCAQENLRVCYPTTPSQLFHLLRRQALAPEKKPLVVMAPKSLLRHPEAVSPLEEFSRGAFRPVLDEDGLAETAVRGILCTGKIYYDLKAQRDKTGRDDLVIVRLEELYPFPRSDLDRALARYGSVSRWTWVQEEPANMGAWTYLRPRLRDLLGQDPAYVGRPESASPATGFHHRHKAEQERIVAQAVMGRDG
ncbi:2-oxoglutarate dehydrogenase E1 component [Desulfacinum hydrothermale DSM 13146]|uniref:oxoglutarate dehydrogenase (succinyl-transferring) n=1 Tax=Desulfacinum hydrothermale DSM 13146 TaxID=1121390 RepID=A0A1W1XNC2_9BACT|nr:2-oxoglutarate dehydrogenase E1 component [Desulfacinum hydrothermale]SMC25367.1 2-oxoglutarate dehydrogenase E1 component [Desulfacinum hydrothermale DSM 13146]